MNPSPESVNDELKSPKDVSTAAHGDGEGASGNNKLDKVPNDASKAAQEWFNGNAANDQFDGMVDNNFGANWLLQDEQMS